MSWIPQAAGAAASVASLFSGRSAAKQQRRLAKDQIRIAGTAYSPIDFLGPGGSSITFGGGSGATSVGPRAGGSQYTGIQDLGNGFRQVGKYGLQSDLGAININQGNLGPLRDALVGSAGDLYGTPVDSSPHFLQQFGQNQLLGAGQYFDSGEGTLDAIDPGAGAAFGLSLQNLLGTQGGFQTGLQNQLFQGAQQQLGTAAGDFGGAYQDTLGLLRQQAEPFESRALADLQARLQRTGQAGTTGGSRAFESFGSGLGQADLARQLSALGEARNQQNQALNVGTTLNQQGSGLASLQDQLTHGAFQRFGLSADLGRALSAQRFQQRSSTGQNLSNLGMNQLSAGAGLLQQPFTLQQLQDDIASGRLSSVQGIDSSSLGNLQATLQAMQNQASTRMGQASFTGNAGQAMAAPAQSGANLLSGLGSALSNNSQLQSLFGRLGNSVGNFFRSSGNPMSAANFDPSNRP